MLTYQPHACCLFVLKCFVSEQSAELASRLVELQRRADERQYRKLVSAVSRDREFAKLDESAGLRAISTQASIGINMMLSSLTLFVVGYWGGQQYFGADSRYPLLLGLFAAIAILAIETVLFILRVDSVHARTDNAPDSRARKRIERSALDALLLSAPPPPAPTDINGKDNDDDDDKAR